jgi:dynein heavy chain, axonemal
MLCCSGLDQWERELHLFSTLKTLKLFQLYRTWKTFKIWRKAVNETKIGNARTVLEKNLFLLSPVFQKPLGRLHRLCHDLSTMRLYRLEPAAVS